MCCNECPSLSSFYDVEGKHNYCNMTEQSIDIKDINKLPKQCPLPDYGEENNDTNNIKG